MKRFFYLLRFEFKNLLISPSTYVSAFLFLSLMTLIYLVILSGFSQLPHNTPPSTQFFQTFWLPVLFMVPLLTMKSVADEARRGTLQTTLATSLSSLAFILAKFFSAYLLYLLLWSITLCFPFIIQQFFLPHSSLHTSLLFNAPSIFGSYLFIALSGLLFIAIGIFTSSLTRSQLIAGILSFSLLFTLIICTRFIFELPFFSYSYPHSFTPSITYLHIFDHLNDFSNGIFDTRALIFYISSSTLLLGTSSLFIRSKV